MTAAGDRIVCVHLYDDFSGSANVCAQVLDAVASSALGVDVLVSSLGSGGFIRTSHPVQTFPYRFPGNRWLRLLAFAAVQLRMFFAVARLCARGRIRVVYASTALPAGAVLAGMLFRRRVVVHLHEVGLGSRALFLLLKAVAVRGADRIVCVSRFVAVELGLPSEKVVVVHNSLSVPDWMLAGDICRQRDSHHHSQPFLVVMACSLRWYKGLDSFVELARHMQERHDLSGQRLVHFELLLNAEEDELTTFLAETVLPANLTTVRRPVSVFSHYRRAHLVVNLSHAEGWIETFGMTLLEAMACGVPVVCPLQGGCTELVIPADGGWRIDSRDLSGLSELISHLAEDSNAWWVASRRATAKAQQFSPDHFSKAITELLAEI